MNSKLTTLDEAQKENGELHQHDWRSSRSRTSLLTDRADGKRAPARDDRLRAGLALPNCCPAASSAASPRTGGTPCRSASVTPSTTSSTKKYGDKYRSGPTSRWSRRAAWSARPAPSRKYVTDVILLVNENCNISATGPEPIRARTTRASSRARAISTR